LKSDKEDMDDISLGSIVRSTAGRDKDKYFIVVALENAEGYYRIADGETRRLEKPKLKKVKHLKSTGMVSEKLAEKFKEGRHVHDAEIRSALHPYAE